MAPAALSSSPTSLSLLPRHRLEVVFVVSGTGVCSCHSEIQGAGCVEPHSMSAVGAFLTNGVIQACTTDPFLILRAQPAQRARQGPRG